MYDMKKSNQIQIIPFYVITYDLLTDACGVAQIRHGHATTKHEPYFDQTIRIKINLSL